MTDSKHLRHFDDLLNRARDENDGVISPEYSDPYRSPLFEFVRVVKGISRLKNASAETALEDVEGWLIRLGYDDANTGWEGEFNVDCAEDARAEFLDLWDRIRYPAGSSPLETARDRAQIYRLRPKRCRTKTYGLFISLAGNLQVLQRSHSILLPCRLTGDVLGLSAMTISRYRRWAIDDGQLKEVKTSRFISGDATEFAFALDRYPPNWRRGEKPEIGAGV